MRASTKKKLFAQHLAAGKSVVSICEELSMSESTGYLWKKDPIVQETVDEIITETRQRIVNQLTNSCASVIGELTKMALMDLADPMNDPRLKIRACQSLLDVYLKLSEIGDLQTKLAEIEGLLSD